MTMVRIFIGVSIVRDGQATARNLAVWTPYGSAQAAPTSLLKRHPVSRQCPNFRVTDVVVLGHAFVAVAELLPDDGQWYAGL